MYKQTVSKFSHSTIVTMDKSKMAEHTLVIVQLLSDCMNQVLVLAYLLNEKHVEITICSY